MSLFSRVLEVRDQFKQISQDNIDFVSSILAGQFTQGTKSFVVSNSIYGSMIYDGLPGSNASIEFRDASTDELISLVPNVTDLSQYQDVILDNTTGLTINDALKQVSSSASLYDALSSITGKFGYLNRMKFDNMVTILQTGSYNDISNLIQSLSMGVDDEGFISINSYFSVINSYFSVLNTSVQSGTPVLDTANPYQVIDLVSIIANVAQTLFSVLIFVLQGIYRVIAAVLSIVVQFFSAMFSALQDKQSTLLDLNASNTFVLGPVLATEYDEGATVGEGLRLETIPYYTLDHHHIYYKESTGIGVFSWFADFDSTDLNYRKTRCNGYLYPYINVRNLAWNRIFQRDTLGQNIYRFTFNIGEIQDPESEFYLPAKGPLSSGWATYGESAVPLDGNEATFSLALDHFIRMARFSKEMTDRFQSVAHGIWEIKFCGGQQVGELYFISDAEKWHDGGWLQYLFSLIQNCYIYGSYDDFVSREPVRANVLLESLADSFAVFIRDKVMSTNSSPFMSFTSFTASPQPWETHSYTFSEDAYPKLTTPLFCGSNFVYVFHDPVYMTFRPFISNADVIVSDCLPASFGIKLPTISTTELMNTLAAVGILITSAVLSAVVIGYKITKMNIAKRALKAEKISQLRKEFIENPTDATAKKNYENAVFKYNLFGSVFGYGSYDGRNGWFDSGSSQSSDYQYSFDDILSKNNQLQNSIGSPSTDLSTLITAIKELIKS